MGISVDGSDIKDNGGTRSGRGRRKSKSMGRKPERRTEKERRSGIDRRNGQNIEANWLSNAEIRLKYEMEHE